MADTGDGRFWSKMDLGFEADPKFRRLFKRLPGHDYYAAVGVFWAALAAARRRGSPVIDVREETGEDEAVANLISVGLLTEEGFPPGTFVRWGREPQQVAAGRVRAAQAVRVGGRFAPALTRESTSGTPAVTSATSALVPLDQRHQPLVSSPLTVNQENDQGGRNLENRVVVDSTGWAYLYPVVVEVTGRHVSGNGSYAATLCELAQQAGPERVVEAIRAVGVAMSPVKPDLRAIAFAVNDALRRPPSGRDLAQMISAAVETREAAAAAKKKAAEEAVRRQRAERLADEFIGTGGRR